MLHPVYRLQIDAEGLVHARDTGRRSWRPLVVVGRELCVFEALPCAGVAWHELAGFARLQAMRLAPYRQSGSSAAVRHQTLMLWFWDDTETTPALARAGIDPATTRFVAEPLMLALPALEGSVRLACAAGVDHLVMARGAIQQSHFELRDKLVSTPVSLLARPWARDHIGQSLADLGSQRSGGLSLRSVLTTMGLLAVVATAAHAAYWGGQLLGAQHHLAAIEAEAERAGASVGNFADLRKLEADDRLWAQTYRKLGATFALDAFLKALETPLAAKGVVIKDLELRNDEARLLLVSTGPEIDLPGVLQALSAMPGVDDVQLRQNIDPQQANFTLKATGYRRFVAGPTSGAP